MSEGKEKFTQGPWRFWRHVNKKYPEMSQTAVFGTGDKRFVMIAQMHDDAAAAPEQTIKEIIANAHLIAAAPEMYFLLIEIAAFFRYGPENGSMRGDYLLSRIEEVLKKARGEE